MSGREFCAPDNSNHPKWKSWDVFKWRVLSEKMGGGRAYLQAYKDGWVVYNKFRIKDAAEQYRIPPAMLGCVAWAEVGGKPDGIKRPVFQGRTLQRTLAGRPVKFGKPPEETSVGAVSIQLRVASKELGIPIELLSYSDRMNLIACLETDTFNLNVVAQHLKNLILYDYPSTDTSNLTDEQFIVAGSRYNRGIERALNEFIDSIKLSPGSQGRQFSEYGRRMLEHRDHILMLLEKV
jgi:hypothetical protein